MISGIQAFVRGCIVDPELERKAHQTLDESRRAVAEVHQVAGKVSRKVDSLKPGQIAAIGAASLIAAGIMIGAVRQAQRNEG